MSGRVLLVGAGPGDPDLITLRGLAALREADVVLYDELASERLLGFAPTEAERINVGKRGHDAPTRSQAEINALMVRLAREGKQVVRLKGGDPFVFGRGGEETSHLESEGVDFEIVPGVSAALGVPAYAGIPVTDRRHAASFAVITGHKDPGEVTAATRWDLLANAVDTLVILMGMRNLDQIVRRLIDAGRPASTPAAAIMWGATPRQQTIEAELADLPKRVAEAGLGAPATVVIGNVVKLRPQLRWFEDLPMFGIRVLVTRAEGQADEMTAALRSLGAEPVVAPMIRIEGVEDSSEVDAALDRLDDYDVLLLASQNAVRFFVERADAKAVSLAGRGMRIFAVGPKTAELALRNGLPVQGIPSERFDAEGLVELLREQLDLAGQRVLIPRSEIGRETLPEALRAAGARVDAVAVYRTLPPADASGELSGQLERGDLDVLTFTSPSTVRNFLAMLGPAAREAVGQCVVAAVGQVTAGTLRSEGIEPDVVPSQAGADELVTALAAHMAEQREQGGGE